MAATTLTVAQEISTVAYGGVPLPRPNSLGTEVYAILMALRRSLSLEELVIDCNGAIKGLIRGRAWATSSGRPWAHLWVLVWDKLEDMNLMPQEN